MEKQRRREEDDLQPQYNLNKLNDFAKLKMSAQNQVPIFYIIEQIMNNNRFSIPIPYYKLNKTHNLLSSKSLSYIKAIYPFVNE